jgi:hypothetical protein
MRELSPLFVVPEIGKVSSLHFGPVLSENRLHFFRDTEVGCLMNELTLKQKSEFHLMEGFFRLTSMRSDARKIARQSIKSLAQTDHGLWKRCPGRIHLSLPCEHRECEGD